MKVSDCLVAASDSVVPLTPLVADELESWLADQPVELQTWVGASGFAAKAGDVCSLPGANGELAGVMVGIGDHDSCWSLADATGKLPAGDFQLAGDYSPEQSSMLGLGWAMASYRFDQYKSDANRKRRRLVVGEQYAELAAEVEAIYLVRDLINTPPNDMMPEHLSARAAELAGLFGADFSEVVGGNLLDQNYPTIHAVGRASSHPPRLLSLEWGSAEHPLVALIGKGVCFDSGGLDLKPSKAMRLMQKDMGGAAHVLGLARAIMSADLPIRLKVLVPAVENAVSGDAFRPGDILQTRSGQTVEIDNTDAEGRLVLCDAMTRAAEDKPDLIIDFATLTGAARVAVGTEIACFFSNDEALVQEVVESGTKVEDPTWQLPLHEAYARQLKSQFADVMNCSPTLYGGAITAALFLQRFVDAETSWLHFDVMAWNISSRAGHPEGGEAMGVRAVMEMLKGRYMGAS